jgi:hypothetical protein
VSGNKLENTADKDASYIVKVGDEGEYVYSHRYVGGRSSNPMGIAVGDQGGVYIAGSRASDVGKELFLLSLGFPEKN